MAHTLQAESASNLFDIISNQEATLNKLRDYLAALDWACASDHELRDVLLDAFDAIVNELIEQNDQLFKVREAADLHDD